MRATVLLLVLLAPLALAQVDPEEEAMTHAVDHLFAPAELEVAPGRPVVVMNFGPSAHTFTANDSSFDVELAAPPEGNWTEAWVTLLAGATEVPFHCRYHPNMTGVLRVQRLPPTHEDPVETPGFGALLALAALSVGAAAWRARARR